MMIEVMLILLLLMEAMLFGVLLAKDNGWVLIPMIFILVLVISILSTLDQVGGKITITIPSPTEQPVRSYDETSNGHIGIGGGKCIGTPLNDIHCGANDE